jgi:hypothetical protein
MMSSWLPRRQSVTSRNRSTCEYTFAFHYGYGWTLSFQAGTPIATPSCDAWHFCMHMLPHLACKAAFTYRFDRRNSAARTRWLQLVRYPLYDYGRWPVLCGYIYIVPISSVHIRGSGQSPVMISSHTPLLLSFPRLVMPKAFPNNKQDAQRAQDRSHQRPSPV